MLVLPRGILPSLRDMLAARRPADGAKTRAGMPEAAR